MIPTNSTLIRKAYDNFANGNIPAVLEAIDNIDHLACARS
jgi:hypothetical protein